MDLSSAVENDLSIKQLDHLGLVAGMCKKARYSKIGKPARESEPDYFEYNVEVFLL